MILPTDSHQTEETKILKEFYSSLNRNDLPEVLKYIHPEIHRIEPASQHSSGIFNGFLEFETHLIQGRSTWAEGGCEIENFVISGDKIIVNVHVRVKLKKDQKWVEGRIADGFVFKSGKIIFMQTFFEREAGLNWLYSKV